MLDIETFDNVKGGNAGYKALAHPVAAEGLARLAARLNAAGRVAIYDPDGIAGPLLALAPAFEVEGIYVHDTLALEASRGGVLVRALTELVFARAKMVLVAAFDAGRVVARIKPFLPAGAEVVTLDEAKLPENLITNQNRYLDAVNFATNFVFFRDDGHFGTRLTTANYWAGYGAQRVRFFQRLYDAAGTLLAEWESAAPAAAGGFVIDSGQVRRRFGLDPFVGQLFIHAVGVAGHDVVKYALDTYATDNGASLSCTHDANAWPADRFAGLPAPRADERVVLWVQNSHAVPIPAGAMALDRMGAEAPLSINEEIPPFATCPVDVADFFPKVFWPAQLEFRAGRHVVRPRYEVTRAKRTRIAHVNVERSDLRPDPGIKTLAPALGRGFLLPFPILARRRYKTIVQPTPMAVSELDLPLRLDVFAPNGEKCAERFLGVLPRAHDIAVDLDDVLPAGVLPDGGHAELVYDFRAGGEANGWLHALFRYEDRASGHVAESSFGAHMFNTIMTYKGEPQSYNGPPPGLSTRLFLKLGFGGRESFCVLIYPASAPWVEKSSTTLELYDSGGEQLASRALEIACSGSVLVYPSAHFPAELLRAAGETGYVLIRDATCRLFGFHGVDDRAGGFSFDHMFGF
jgi:phage tail protein X